MIAFSDVMNKQDDVADCENGDYDGHNVDEDYDGDDNDGDDGNDDENDNGDDDDDAWAGMIIRRVQFWGRAAISPPSPPTQLLSICLPTIIIIMPIIIILRYFQHSKQSLNGTRLNQGISPRLLQSSSFIPAHRSLVVYNGPPIIDTRPLHRFHPSYSRPQANSQREIANNRILGKSHTLLYNNCRNQINMTKKRCSKVSLPFTNPVQSISSSYKKIFNIVERPLFISHPLGRC